MTEGVKLIKMTPRQALDRAMIGAAFKGDQAEVRRLLDHGAQIEALDNTGRTPLAQASMGDRHGVCHFLLDRGARIDARDNHGNTPLAIAIMWNRPLSGRALIDRGANLHTVNDEGESLFSLAINRQNKYMCWRLIANGASIQHVKILRKEFHPVLGASPLQAAVHLGDARLLLKVLKCDPDAVSLPERAGQALAMALEAGQEETTTLLRSWLARSAVLDAMFEMNPHTQAIP